MTYLLSLGKAIPEYRHKQEDILIYMKKNLKAGDKKEKRSMDIVYKRSRINTRYSVLPDFSGPGQPRFFDEKKPMPGLEERMKFYCREAPPLAEEAAKNCLGKTDRRSITHLITVSCTGMSAPGLDIELVERLDLSISIHRTSVNFMGCYAVFHALKQADAICQADPHSRVLVVAAELCTLHFQNLAKEAQIIAHSLFSDGAAAALVSGEKPSESLLPRFIHFDSRIALDGKSDMAWHLSEKGFLMTLSAHVPTLVGQDLEQWILPIVSRDFPGIEKEKISWAFHPGGPQILDRIAHALALDKKFLASSFKVLRKYGNMSSPTILFVLDDLWEKMVEERKPVFVAGFGPGLTMEAMTMKAHK